MSAVLVGVGLFIRLQLTESPEFLKLQSQGKALRAPIVDVWTHAKVHTLLVVGAQTAVNVGYYVVVVFGLSYATSNAGISRTAALAALIIGAHFADLVAVPFCSGRCQIGLAASLCWSAAAYSSGCSPFPFFLMVQSGSVVLLSIAVALGSGPGPRAGLLHHVDVLFRGLRRPLSLQRVVDRLPFRRNGQQRANSVRRKRAAARLRRYPASHRSYGSSCSSLNRLLDVADRDARPGPIG